MPTIFLKGDPFEEAASRAGTRALVIDGDTSGALDAGAGIAFAKRWPAVAEAYKDFAADGKAQLGDVFVAADGDLSFLVFALRRPGGAPTLAALQRALEATAEFAEDSRVAAILFPRVGGGKGGVDWTRAKRIFTDAGVNTAADLVVFEQFIRKAPGSTNAEDAVEGDEAEGDGDGDATDEA